MNFRKPYWDEIWMGLAFMLARRSCHPTTAVGCVIVSPDNRQVLGVGYNGDENGGSNTVTSLEPGQSGLIHAEINALIKTRETKGAAVYVTHSPCEVCARALVNADVSLVVYAVPYRDQRPIKILEDRGIDVIHQSNPWEDA